MRQTYPIYPCTSKKVCKFQIIACFREKKMIEWFVIEIRGFYCLLSTTGLIFAAHTPFQRNCHTLTHTHTHSFTSVECRSHYISFELEEKRLCFPKMNQMHRFLSLQTNFDEIGQYFLFFFWCPYTKETHKHSKNFYYFKLI